VVVLHFVGGKPWSTPGEMQALGDWEEDGTGSVERAYGPLMELWRRVARGEGGGEVPVSGGKTTGEEDRRKVEEMRERMGAAAPSPAPAAEIEPAPAIPAVIIEPGANKYVLCTGVDPSTSARRYFVRSSASAEYHRDAADPLVTQLLAAGYSRVDVTGGGRILCLPEERRVVVHGFSYGFGKADHESSADLIRLEDAYCDWDITWNDEGY
jgi:phosphohistidine phosphatase